MIVVDKMLSRLGVYILQIDKRAAALAAGGLTFWLFGDSLLPVIAHGLHLGIEVIELAFEHFLEWAFGLSPRAAQTITFWTGFVGIVYGSFRLLRRTYVELRRAWDATLSRLRRWVKEEPSAWIGHPYARLTLTVGAISATVYLLA